MLKSLLLALIWLQTWRVGLAWIWWVVACITAHTNAIFITNRIFPTQYWKLIALVAVHRDNTLNYFLSADRWFLSVYLSKEKVLFKKNGSNPYLGTKASQKIQEIFPHNKQNTHNAYWQSCRHGWMRYFTQKSNDTVKGTNTQVCGKLAIQ